MPCGSLPAREVIRHHGGPDELWMVEEECPEPKPGEVRVRVLAAGVGIASAAGFTKSLQSAVQCFKD